MSTWWPTAHPHLGTTPSAGAVMWCSIFMASSTTRVWRASTTVAGRAAHLEHHAGHGGDEAAVGKLGAGDDEAGHDVEGDGAPADLDVELVAGAR